MRAEERLNISALTLLDVKDCEKGKKGCFIYNLEEINEQHFSLLL